MEHFKSPHSRQKTMITGATFGRILTFYNGSVWGNVGMNRQDALHSVSAAQSSEIGYRGFKMEIRWLSTSPSFQGLRSMANL